MKKVMSIAVIALMMVGSVAIACDTCGCKDKKAEKKECSTCDSKKKGECAEKKCEACTAEKKCEACTKKCEKAETAEASEATE